MTIITWSCFEVTLRNVPNAFTLGPMDWLNACVILCALVGFDQRDLVPSVCLPSLLRLASVGRLKPSEPDASTVAGMEQLCPTFGRCGALQHFYSNWNNLPKFT